MSDDQEKTKKFKLLLDQLPYFTEGEKIVACSMYLTATDDIRIEMENFFQQQVKDFQSLVNNYDQEIESARKDFANEVGAIIGQTQQTNPS